MVPQDPKIAGDAVAAAITDLVSQIPPEQADLRDQATAVAEDVATYVDLVRIALLRYRLLFEEAPDPYVVTDEYGRITETNAAARAMLGTSMGDLAGVELASFVSDEDTPDFERWLARLRAGEPELRWDAMFQVPGEKPIPVEISLADDLEGIGYRWGLREQQQRTAVEQHLRDVAASEHHAAEKLRADAQVQAAFLIALSHDLRAPIGALVHQSQLLGSEDISPDLRRRSAETLEENARMLSRMMEDLIDIERHAQGELELDLRRTSLSSVLDAIGNKTVEVRREDGDAAANVDVDVLARAIRSMIRAIRRRTSAALVEVTGRVTDDSIEILVTAAVPGEEPVDSDDAIRSIEARLTSALVEAHGGSVSAVPGGLVLRLPRLL